MIKITKQDTFVFSSFIVGIYLIAWIIQNNLCLNWDVSQLLHATRLMLSGGTYTQDFFIPNPPMILFLYTPPIILSKLLHVKIMIPFRIYIYLLSTLSLILCCSLARSIFSKEDKFLTGFFLVTLASLYLVLPFCQFGQRDILLFILIMPYLFLVTLRLQDTHINHYYAVLIGLLAGVGVSIKPHFFIIPFLIECRYIFTKRNVYALLRPELLSIIVLSLFYTSILFVFYPDFVATVIPFILHSYYSNVGISWPTMILNPLASFSLIAILFYITQYKNNRYRILSSILMIALMSFLILYFSQRTTFMYHLLPCFFMAILLLVLLYGMLITQRNLNKIDYICVALTNMAMAFFLLHYFASIWTILFFQPFLFFTFFAVLFSLLLYVSQEQKNLFKIFLSVTLILAITVFSAHIAKGTSWYAYTFIIASLILFALFGLFASKNYRNLGSHVTIAILGTLVFCMPFDFAIKYYIYSSLYKKIVLNDLISFVKKQPPQQSIYVFSTRSDYAAPLIDYTNLKLVERFDCLWMIPDLIKRKQAEGDTALRQYIKNNSNPNFFLNMIIEDMQKHKPDLIFVDVKNKNVYVYNTYNNFDYINYFSENKFFRAEWSHYHYLTTLQSNNNFIKRYSLNVYKRNIQ